MAETGASRPIPAWSQARALYLLAVVLSLILPFGACGGMMTQEGVVIRGLGSRPSYPGVEPHTWTVSESTYRGTTTYSLHLQFSDANGAVHMGSCKVRGPRNHGAEDAVAVHAVWTWRGVTACPADALSVQESDGTMGIMVGVGALALAAFGL